MRKKKKGYSPETIASLETLANYAKSNYNSLNDQTSYMFQTYGADVAKLVLLMTNDKTVPAGIRLKAMEMVLERGLGKVTQGISFEGKMDVRHAVVTLPEISRTPILKLDSGFNEIKQLDDGNIIEAEIVTKEDK